MGIFIEDNNYLIILQNLITVIYSLYTIKFYYSIISYS